jgi:hypothetical protein
METRGIGPPRVGSLLELEPRFGGAFLRPRTGLQPRHVPCQGPLFLFPLGAEIPSLFIVFVGASLGSSLPNVALLATSQVCTLFPPAGSQ